MKTKTVVSHAAEASLAPIVKAVSRSMPTTTPNPSIEGMPKRLRLLVTPHVKR